MKKMLSILILTLGTVLSTSAHMGMSAARSDEPMKHKEIMQTLMDFKRKLQGKTVELPGSLEKEGAQLKARFFRLIAEELKDCGNLNYKAGTPQAKKYADASQKVAAAADALEALPFKDTMKKKFDRIGEWMNLMMDKKQLKAKFLKEVARSVGDKEMERKAEKFGMMIEKFRNTMENQGGKEVSVEESEEVTTEGCPADAQDEEMTSEEAEEQEEE